MKKRVVRKGASRKEATENLNCGDIGMAKWSVVFGTLFLIGLLGYWVQPASMINFIVRWKWVSLILMIFLMLRPMRKFCRCCK